MPLVIHGLGGGDTHTNTHTDVCTKVISINQARAWFKNLIGASMNELHASESNSISNRFVAFTNTFKTG